MEHSGEHPLFILRPVTFHKSALTRQVAEAVRIRRRGGEGSILNSRSEFNRCHIPRLQLEEQEPEDEIIRREQEERDRITRELEDNLTTWRMEKTTTKAREAKKAREGRRTTKCKREQEQQNDRGANKRRKYQLMSENWGEATGASMEPEKLPNEGEPQELAGLQVKEGDSPGVSKEPGTPGYPFPVLVNLQEGAPPTQVHPRVGDLCEGDLGGVAGVGGGPNPSSLLGDKCDMDTEMMLCNTHQCQVKKLSVPVNRWRYDKKKMCYGWKKVRIPKFSCSSRNKACREPEIFTESDTAVALVKEGVGGASCNTVQRGLAESYSTVKSIQKCDREISRLERDEWEIVGGL